jgi:hypothetical protein
MADISGRFVAHHFPALKCRATKNKMPLGLSPEREIVDRYGRFQLG